MFAATIAIMVVLLPVAVGEAVVRVAFRDGGRRTIGGPGGSDFDYEYIVAEWRTPRANPARPPGLERIVVLGDSITWGIGVRDWQDIYPNQLLKRLIGTGRQFDMEVFAKAGRNIDGHLRTVQDHVARLAPDYLIYQWYINDIEVDGPSPHEAPPWHQFALHRWLQAHSWLYYAVDVPLGAYVSGKAYQRYMLGHYAGGSPAWDKFADQFHRWATFSTAYSPHVAVVLYPQVPFRGPYPLEAIHARVRSLGGPHLLRYPAPLLQNERRWWDTPEGFVLHSDRRRGTFATSPAIPLRRGRYDFAARIKLDRPAQGDLGALDVIAGEDRILAHRVLKPADFATQGSWVTVSLTVDLDAPLTPDVRWLVQGAAGVDLSLEALSVPVSYERLDMIDLTDRLNRFNTHASLFDAHPNERTHGEMADVLAAWVLSKRQ